MNRFFVCFCIVILCKVSLAKDSVYLSEDVYKSVKYSNIFMEQGVLVRNINYDAVKELIPQLNAIYKLNLEDRGEAHITVITPPEFTGVFNPNRNGLHNLFTTNEVHSRYKNDIQNTNFEIVCLGKRDSTDGRTVFFLVTEAPDLFDIRNDLSMEYEKRGLAKGIATNFNPSNYWPHITVGYVKGDVHGVTKGQETCIDDLELVLVR